MNRELMLDKLHDRKKPTMIPSQGIHIVLNKSFLPGEDAVLIPKTADESLQVIKAQVIWAVREVMAMTIEDVLSRRTRCQLLDSRESIRIAYETAAIMAGEMGKDKNWIKDQVLAYQRVTKNYYLE